MQFVDAIPVLLVAALVLLCWAIIPGVVAGWMLREAGGSYGRGFLLGALCGPLGVLGALAHILVTSLWDARRRAARKRAGARHMYRRVPLVGSLHVSTVWALAGLATFACVWVLGVVGYELYLSRRHALRESARLTSSAADRPRPAQGVGPEATSGPDTAAAAAPAGAAQPLALAGKTPRPASSALLDGLAARPAEKSAPTPAGLAPESRRGAEPQSYARPGPPPAASGRAPTPEQKAAATPAPHGQPAVSRESVVAELTQSLAARGYRVHAAVSGDARTSTLSLSCATLSRPLGNQLVGNSRTRAALKAAGFRIVVMINGQESWTYIL